ncbi:MAG: galactokinase [Lentisphaerae bacterium]|nr:galactokinase [Lentisphaerota bacterium]
MKGKNMNNQLVREFTARFGAAPEAVSQAPGRLEILGNHTDYNQGFVLSCAVGLNTAFAARRIPGTRCTVRDFRDGSEKQFDLNNIDTAVKGDWSNYVKGMIVALRRRGFTIGAFEAGMRSTVPLSAGMSSSAAFETAAGFTLRELFDVKLSNEEWALAGQEVENAYLGLKTGLLDQFSSIFGKKDSIILSDFRKIAVMQTVQLPAGYAVAVINSMKKHNLVDSEYNTRRADCENAAAVMRGLYPEAQTLRDISLEQLAKAKDSLEDREYRRALHVVGECTRVHQAVKFLEKGDVAGFGKLWFESHESSRVNFENSTPELDYLIELAHSIPGALGARLSGGGFGGITIHLVKNDQADEYARKVCAAYKLRTGIDAEYYICELGDGACSEKIN